MCNNHSESGQPCGFEPCEAYKELRADLILALAAADNAEGHVKDILARESKELDEIKRLKAEESELRQRLESSQQDHLDTIIERDALKQENQLLRAENVNLSMAHGPGNHTDWMLTRASKYEQLHIDLEKLRQERDALRQSLNDVVERHTRVDALEARHAG